MDADQDLMVAAARIEMVLGKAYAGREMTISARIVSDPPADLGGRRLEICGTAGTVVAELPIGPTGDDGVAQIDVPVPERRTFDGKPGCRLTRRRTSNVGLGHVLSTSKSSRIRERLVPAILRGGGRSHR
jgi:hypothetical protein